MFFVQAGDEINQKPNNKKNGKRHDVNAEKLAGWNFTVTQIQRQPQRKDEQKYVAQKQQNGLFFAYARHRI